MDQPFPLELPQVRNPPTYVGWVPDTASALIIIRLVVSGDLHFVTERPSELDRPELIRSGNVFVVRELHVRRWTDGRRWSPSRALGQFMLYREVENRQPLRRALHEPIRHRVQVDQEHALYGPLERGFNFTENGLFKKTFCAVNTLTEETYRLISYYMPEDVQSSRIPTLDVTLLYYLFPNSPSIHDNHIIAKPGSENGNTATFQPVAPPPDPNGEDYNPEMPDPPRIRTNHAHNPRSMHIYYQRF